MAWIGAAIAAGGALMNNMQSQGAADNATSGQQQFIRDMRRSAYPETVQSMKDAGLNPMLAYSQGALPSNASTPLMPNLQNIGAAGVEGYSQQSSAELNRQQAGNIEQEMKSFETRMKKLGYETDQAWWSAMAQKFKAGILGAEDMESVRYYTARAKEMAAAAELRGLEVPEGVANAAMWASEFGKVLPYAKEGLGAVGSATGAAKNLRKPGGGITIKR